MLRFVGGALVSGAMASRRPGARVIGKPISDGAGVLAATLFEDQATLRATEGTGPTTKRPKQPKQLVGPPGGGPLQLSDP